MQTNKIAENLGVVSPSVSTALCFQKKKAKCRVAEHGHLGMVITREMYGNDWGVGRNLSNVWIRHSVPQGGTQANYIPLQGSCSVAHAWAPTQLLESEPPPGILKHTQVWGPQVKPLWAEFRQVVAWALPPSAHTQLSQEGSQGFISLGPADHFPNF